MIPSFIQGSIAPVFTAFTATGAIDEAGQRNLLDFLLERGGISAYFLRCGMGQMYAFEEDDVHQMIRLATDHMKGRAPLMLGCSGIWDRNYDKRPERATYTAQAVAFCRAAEAHGADAVVLTIPEGIAPEGEETPHDVVIRYFEAVTAAASGPVFIYQPPGTDPAYCVNLTLMARLAAMPHVNGIKVSTADAGYLVELGEALENTDTALVCGNENAYYAALMAGAQGAIGQGTTLNPHLVNAVAEAFARGDLAGAMRAQRAVNLLCRESVNSVAFFLRYAREHGYAVEDHARQENNPYMANRPVLSEAEYQRFKALFEATLGAGAVG